MAKQGAWARFGSRETGLITLIASTQQEEKDLDDELPARTRSFWPPARRRF